MRTVKFLLATCLILAVFCAVEDRTSIAQLLANAAASDETLPPFINRFATGEPLILPDEGKYPFTRQPTAGYPNDPTGDIRWSGGFSGVDDIESAFDNSRGEENSQLGTSLPAITLPSQAEWDSMSDAEKALWLINRERTDRGMPSLHRIDTNVMSVAQNYAQYLFDNNTSGHYADGNSPWERLNNNAAIGACHDFLSVAENLAYFVTTGNSIPLPVERSVFAWIYTDEGSNWGHRHAILWDTYNDNSGPSGMEGFLGIGRASGGPYQGPFREPWNHAEIIVMNVFDPCSIWDYGSPPEPPATITYPSIDTDGSFTVSWSAASGATGYQLQRSPDSSFSSAITLYTGPSNSYSESGLSKGTYYYRVGAQNASGISDWTTSGAIRIGVPLMPWLPFLLDH